MMKETDASIKETAALIAENAAEMRPFIEARRQRERLLRALWDIKWRGI
jgi:hypothetical protein